jgi:hypothetical protein
MHEFIETDRGIRIKGRPDYAKADAKAKELSKRQRETPIHIGDFLNYAQDAYGEKFSQLTAYFPERLYITLAGYKSVTKAVPYDVRPPGVRYSQLDAVRTLSSQPETQKMILEMAVENNLGYDEIRQNFAEYFGGEKLPSMVKRESLPIPSDFHGLYQLAVEVIEKLKGLAGGEQRDKIEKALSYLRELG